MVIHKEFFQAAASVLPTIFVAFAISSRLLDQLSDPREPGEGDLPNENKKLINLGGTAGIISVVAIVAATIALEAFTLLALAFDKPWPWIFYLDLVMFGLLACLTGLKVLEPVLLQAKHEVAQIIIMSVAFFAVILSTLIVMQQMSI